jgi:SAM-dependent methyltransferase
MTSSETPLFERYGYCPICEEPARFVAHHAWLRDHYRCARCSSIPRERALMTVLERYYPGWRDLKIHESSPGMPSSLKIQREAVSYLPTHYFPGIPPGSMEQGFRCENLSLQTFPDASFDLVITQDVLEHVLNPAGAFREIARTLKPGGAHVFTTPIYRGLDVSEVKARAGKDGQIEHLAKPEYHGNPIDAGGSLVTMHYGADLPSLVFDACRLFTTVYVIEDRTRGIEGEFLEVCVTRKSAPAD